MEKNSVNQSAIVLSMFGTSVEKGLPGLLRIRDMVRGRFPRTPVRIAFTSSIVREIWRNRAADHDYLAAHPDIPEDVFAVQSLERVVMELMGRGVGTLIVQHVQIAPFEKKIEPEAYLKELYPAEAKKSVPGSFRTLVFGRPALGILDGAEPCNDDIVTAAGTLAQDALLAEKEQAALFYMGHGNKMPSTSRVYNELVEEMRRQYPDVVTVMSLVEGAPSFESIVEKLKEANIGKLLLKPFMIVAGDHVRKDMIGTGSRGLKPRLEEEGFEVIPVMNGLSENTAFADIFIQHILDAARIAGIKLS